RRWSPRRRRWSLRRRKPPCSRGRASPTAAVGDECSSRGALVREHLALLRQLRLRLRDLLVGRCALPLGAIAHGRLQREERLLVLLRCVLHVVVDHRVGRWNGGARRRERRGPALHLLVGRALHVERGERGKRLVRLLGVLPRGAAIDLTRSREGT